MKSAFFFAPFLASFCNLSAQHQDTVGLPDVEIQSNRLQIRASETDRNIDIIDAKTIQSMPVKSVAEILSFVSGVDVRQRGPWGSQSDLSIQGGSFEQSLVLIDGVRCTDPQTGHNTMNIPVPLEMIERIEILKGPAAARYGLNAISGAINIITKNAPDTFADFRMYSGSSFTQDTSTQKTYYNNGVGFAAGGGVRKSTFILSGGLDRGNGFRYNTAYLNSRLFALIKNNFNERNAVQIQAGYINNFFGANAFYAAPGDKESEESVETALAAVTYFFKGKKWTLVPQVSYRYNYDHYVYIRQKPQVYENRHFSHVVNPKIDFTYAAKMARLALGAEYRTDDLNSNNLGKRSRNNTGVYGEFLWNPKSTFSLLLGSYLLYHSEYKWGFFPSLEMGWQFSKKSRLFFNAGSAQRIPSYTDLYYKGPLNISNPNLKPEESVNAELGIKKKNSRVYLQSSVFLRDINQLIDWVRDSVSMPWSPINYNTSRTIGAEIRADYVLVLHWKNIRDLYFQGAYTYLDQSFLRQESQLISKNGLENLRHQFVFSVSSTIFKSLNFRFAVRNLVRNNMQAYTLADAHLAYKIRSLSVFADVNNILGTEYREISTVPLLPRWFTFGVRMHLKP